MDVRYVPRDWSNRASEANEGCFGGCILPIILLPFMIVVAPFVWMYSLCHKNT